MFMRFIYKSLYNYVVIISLYCQNYKWHKKIQKKNKKEERFIHVKVFYVTREIKLILNIF